MKIRWGEPPGHMLRVEISNIWYNKNMSSSSSFLGGVHFVSECKEKYRVGLWQCPQFLFIIMGTVTVLTMIATYYVGILYTEPEVLIFIVMGVTVVIFSVGNLVVSSFEHIADLNRAKSEFISVASHQLRSPLSAMKWSLGLLLSGTIGRFEEKPIEYLKILKDSNDRMIDLVNDLLNVNRIESGQLMFSIKPFKLDDAARAVLNDFTLLAKASNIKLTLDVPDLLPLARGDESKVKIVIENFIDNAIKYTKEDGEIRLVIERREGELLLRVTDHGVGIPRAQQGRVFEKFFRADNTLKYQTKGTGLGLFISKSIVETLGGKMGFTSEENKGSTFWFTLPITN